MLGRRAAVLMSSVVIVPAIMLGVVAAAQAAPGDLPTPAGTGVGSVVVFGPAPGTPSGIAPGLAVPHGMILVPVPATGSLVFPAPVPPASGAGPSFVRYVIVIPGPNAAQNTGVALQLHLRVTLGVDGAVTVYPIPAP